MPWICQPRNRINTSFPQCDVNIHHRNFKLAAAAKLLASWRLTCGYHIFQLTVAISINMSHWLISEFGISFAHSSVRGIWDKQTFSAAEVGAGKNTSFVVLAQELVFVYSVFIPNDLWNIPWFFAHCEIPNSLITSNTILVRQSLKGKSSPELP